MLAAKLVSTEMAGSFVYLIYNIHEKESEKCDVWPDGKGLQHISVDLYWTQMRQCVGYV